jgi:transcriptional regulator with XRE-family HTH domain
VTIFIKKRNIMRNTKLKLGETIRKRREILGLLQPQLASISGVSLRTIQMVEGGKANPSIGTLTQIADPLGLRLQLIIKDPTQKEEG